MKIKAKIAKWYKNKDVAFAIGVDELPIGGSFKDGPENEEWDCFYWYRSKNDFWTLYWKPILDDNPWIKYSIGWVASHNTPNNLQNYPEPKNINHKELSWKTKTGQKWIKEVLKPIFSYGNKHYDEWVGHGYWHEEGMNRYYPYWFSKSPLLKSEDQYKFPKFLFKTFKEMQEAFKQTFNHNCNVWNTLPFGAGRPDLPSLFIKNRLYGLGLWSNLSKQPLDKETGLYKTSDPIKCFTKPIGSKIVHEGSSPEHKYEAITGDIKYWYQDTSIEHDKAPFKLNKNDKIVVAPYSLGIEGSKWKFKRKVKKMMESFKNFDSPFLYYFLHAQMNWIDALGGGSIVHRIKEHKAWIFSFLILGILALFVSSIKFAKIGIIILGIMSFIILMLFFTREKINKRWYQKIVFSWGYGRNAKRHNQEMQWLYENYKDRLWITTFSEVCQYFDLRKQSKVDIKENNKSYIITIDSSKSLGWNKRKIPLSLIMEGIKGKNFEIYQDNKRINSKIRKLDYNSILIENIEILPQDNAKFELVIK